MDKTNLSGLEFSLAELSMDEIIVNRHAAGEVWVNASSIYQRMDKGQDEKLRQIMSTLQSTPCPPYRKNWDKDTLRYAAQGSKEWTQFLDDFKEAYKTMLSAINERDTWKAIYEAKRSKNVDDRNLP